VAIGDWGYTESPAVTGGDDCDDNEITVKPAGSEICDGLHNNCSDASWTSVPPDSEIDNDDDTFVECTLAVDIGDWGNSETPEVTGGGDCDDTEVSVKPGGSEICDGLHNNCSDASWTSVPPDDEVDDDDDTFVECTLAVAIGNWGYTESPAVTGGDDCDDTAIDVNPETNWYADEDGDTYGDNAAPAGGNPQCDEPDSGDDWSYVTNNLDCEGGDGDATLNPDTYWYRDGDEDTYGSTERGPAVHSCSDPSNGWAYVRTDDDCDDYDPLINPTLVWYLDFDEDTYGSDDTNDDTTSCLQPVGYVDRRGDCNDYDSSVHEGATEDCGDGIDSNCDGSGGPDDSDDSDGLTYAQEHGVGANDCSLDSDGDHVPDAVEWLEGDTDLDGDWDIIDTDDDGDLVPTVEEDYDGDNDPTNDHTDELAEEDAFWPEAPEWAGRDDIPDYLDEDDDGDSILTIDEDLNSDLDPTNDDVDGDHIPNYLDDDDDGDGIYSIWEEAWFADPYHTDSDLDSISDTTEWGALDSEPDDFDGDGVPDIVDEDDDDDGIETFHESPDDLDGDVNCVLVGDGYPSYIDIDSDGDLICDGSHWTVAGTCFFWDGPTDGNDLELPDGPDRDATAATLYFAENFDDQDLDFVPNVYDCDDLDGGAGDADGDGLTSLEELGICFPPPDESECLDPVRRDTDGDGINDGYEVGVDPGEAEDSDTDGVPDALDTDDDGDGVPTETELDGVCIIVPDEVVECDDNDMPATLPDYDDDSIPDYLDTDDDGDGILTIDEDWDGDGDPTNDDRDGDGDADYLDTDHLDGPLADKDYDGVANGVEDLNWNDVIESGESDPANPDSDFDGVLDGLEYWLEPDVRLDSDGDSILDANDPDDDGDKIPTALEGMWDVDGDGDPNYLDLDSDGDGKIRGNILTDQIEGGDAYEAGDELPDTDGDGVPDFLDPLDDLFATDDTGNNNHELSEPGCKCGSVPAPAGGLWLLGLALMAVMRRRRLDAAAPPPSSN